LRRRRQRVGTKQQEQIPSLTADMAKLRAELQKLTEQTEKTKASPAPGLRQTRAR